MGNITRLLNRYFKTIKDMKKNYVSPLTAEVNVVTENIIAASLPVGSDSNTTVDTSTPGTQLGNTNRGEWGNLWNK